MTIKELKRAINDLSDDMDVMIYQSNDEFSLSVATHSEVRQVQYQDEDIDENEWPMEDCFVITDEN